MKFEVVRQQCEAAVQGAHTIYFHRCRSKKIVGTRKDYDGKETMCCGKHMKPEFIIKFTGR